MMSVNIKDVVTISSCLDHRGAIVKMRKLSATSVAVRLPEDKFHFQRPQHINSLEIQAMDDPPCAITRL